MFQQIINEMAVLKNWSKSEKGWIFNCDHYKEEDLQPVLSFFKLHNLEPIVFDFEKTKQIELSEQDVDCYLGNRWTPPVKKEELQRL